MMRVVILHSVGLGLHLLADIRLLLLLLQLIIPRSWQVNYILLHILHNLVCHCDY